MKNNCLGYTIDGSFVFFFLIINKNYFKKPVQKPMKSNQ